MSDLHIDSNNFGKDELETLITLLKDKKIQHLHIVGDIANGFEKTSQEFLAQLQCQLPVTFSLGNHDMLGLSEEAMRPFEFQKIPFSKHTLLAFSGWYDYSFVPTISPQKHLQTKNLFWFDRRLQRMGSDPAITQRLLRELETELMQVDQPSPLKTSVCLQTWQSKQLGSSGHQKQSQLSKLLQQWINRMPRQFLNVPDLLFHFQKQLRQSR